MRNGTREAGPVRARGRAACARRRQRRRRALVALDRQWHRCHLQRPWRQSERHGRSL